MVFHLSQIDSKSLQVLRVLLYILSNLNEYEILIVSIRPPISNPASTLNKSSELFWEQQL